MPEEQNNTIEEFRKIEGFSNYSISNLGRVRRDTSWGKTPPGRILITALNKNGYPRIGLRGGKTRKSLAIHRLVAIAFLDNKNDAKEVNHRSGVKTDCRVTNLEWCSSSENKRHAEIMGLTNHAKGDAHYSRRCPEKMPRGLNHVNAKLSDAQVRSIRNFLAYGFTHHAIAQKFSVSDALVDMIASGKRRAVK